MEGIALNTWKKMTAVAVSIALFSLTSGVTWAGSGASVVGLVTDTSASAPVAGAVVTAQTSDGARQIATTTSDPNGRFVLADLPAGDYRLAVQTPSGDYASPTPVAVADGTRQKVALHVNPLAPAMSDGSGALVGILAVIVFGVLVAQLDGDSDDDDDEDNGSEYEPPTLSGGIE